MNSELPAESLLFDPAAGASCLGRHGCFFMNQLFSGSRSTVLIHHVSSDVSTGGAGSLERRHNSVQIPRVTLQAIHIFIRTGVAFLACRAFLACPAFLPSWASRPAFHLVDQGAFQAFLLACLPACLPACLQAYLLASQAYRPSSDSHRLAYLVLLAWEVPFLGLFQACLQAP